MSLRWVHTTPCACSATVMHIRTHRSSVLAEATGKLITLLIEVVIGKFGAVAISQILGVSPLCIRSRARSAAQIPKFLHRWEYTAKQVGVPCLFDEARKWIAKRSKLHDDVPCATVAGQRSA